MQLSDRIKTIIKGGSDGWDVFYRARAMIDAGEDVTELTIGEHDIKTDAIIMDAMNKSAQSGNTGYALVPGQMDLRMAVAARVEKRTGVATSWRNVIITPGGQSSLFSAHMAVCDPGDRALYCDPYYATYPGVLRGVGAVDVAVPTYSRHNFQPQLADLDAAATGARSLLVNSPNNPTGVVYDTATLDGIAATCIKHDLWLISDEVYDTQIWQGSHISPRALPNMEERTIVVGSMSKSHAMTGFRIGWIIAPQDVVNRIQDLAMVTTFGVAGFIQDAALFALNQGAELEEKVGETFRRRRLLAMQVLKGANAVRLVPSTGAMYLMLDIRATGLTGEAFAGALLDKEKIAVMPGESFGQSAAGHVRVAMTFNDSRFVDALNRLGAFAQSQI